MLNSHSRKKILNQLLFPIYNSKYVNRISSNVHHLVVYLLDGYAMERTTVLIMRMKATANLLQQVRNIQPVVISYLFQRSYKFISYVFSFERLGLGAVILLCRTARRAVN